MSNRLADPHSETLRRTPRSEFEQHRSDLARDARRQARTVAMMSGQRWRDRAKCGDMHPDLFDLTGEHKVADPDARAVELCAGCPVMVMCAAEAIDPLSVGLVRAATWVPATASAPARRRQVARLAYIAGGGAA